MMLIIRMMMPATASPRTNFGRAIHRTVEVRLLRDLLAPALGLLLVDQAGVEVGVDRHLPGIASRGEARRHSAIRPAPLVITTKLITVG